MKARQIFGAVVVVVFGAGMAIRPWLARKQREEREAMMRSLADSSAKTFHEIDEMERRRFHEQQQAELRKMNEQLEALQKKAVAPVLLPMDGRPRDGGAAHSPTSQHLDAVVMPHHFVVTNADLCRAPLDMAPQKDYRERGAKKELVAAATALQDELKKSLGPNPTNDSRFPDLATVAALGPRLDGLIARIEATLTGKTWREMALKNCRDLREDLRDFERASGFTPDGGAR